MKVRLPRLLSANMQPDKRLHPSEARITFNENAPHTATLYLPPGEPEIKLHDWVQLFTIHGSAGMFRANNPGQDVGVESRVSLRHGICVAADDVVKLGEDEITGTLAELLARFWTATGVTVTPQYWQLGSIASTDVIKYEPAGHTLLQAIQTVLKKARNCALEYDQSVFPWVLNVVRRTDANPCEARFSRNLDGVSIDVDDSDQCTRVYLDDRDGYTDADTISQWGVMSRILTVPENATDDSIAAYVADYLDTHKDPIVTIEATGADLSERTGESLDRLTLGRMCRACLPSYGMTVEERIMSVDVPDVYGDPEGVRISMSNRVETLSDLLVTVERDTADLQSTAVRTGRRVGSAAAQAEGNRLELIKQSEELTDTRYRMSLAGIIIDGDYSLVQLLARQSLVEDTRERLSYAGIDIDGAAASVELLATAKVTDDIRQRLSYAGITIDGDAASVKLLATQATVDGVESSLNEAWIEINGAKSEITLKANKVTVDALETHINNLIAGSVKAPYLRTTVISADTANVGNLFLDGSSVGMQSMEVMTGHSISLTKAKVTINGIIYNFVTGVSLSKDTETIEYLVC